MMQLQHWTDAVGKPTCDILRDFRVGGIPGFRSGLDGQMNAGFVSAPQFLQLANVDFSDQFKPSFRRLLYILPKQIPVLA